MTALHPGKIDTPHELVLRARKGDTKAFGKIYELWVNSLYRFVYLKTKDEDVAEDLTAEVFLKAWKGLKTFVPRKDVKFSTWLFSIARNSVIDYYRVTKQTLSLDDLPEIPEMIESIDLYPEQTKLQDALKHLKPEYRIILELRYIQDIPISKIAQKLKKKEGNIRTLTNRALKKLKEIVESDSGPDFA